MSLTKEFWKLMEPLYHTFIGDYNKWAHQKRDKSTTYSYPEAVERIRKMFREHEKGEPKKWDRSYWYVGSPIWNATFTKVTYNTGDVVWISKQTGRVYCGRTHDGWLWHDPSSPLEHERDYPKIIALKGVRLPK